MTRELTTLAGAFALAMAAQTALAADIPARAPAYKAPIAAPIFNWSGFYLGVQGGYGWGDTRHDFPGGTHDTFDVNGWLGGVTIGANWQTGQTVVGLEGDYAWASIDGSQTGNCVPSCSTELKRVGTARLRLGHAWDQWLGYVTGGFAFGEVRAWEAAFSDTDWRTGWTAGLGVEGAIGHNWTVKLEYLYVDLGDHDSYNFAGIAPHDVSFDAHIVRVGLNYRFATGKTPAAVVTRY